LPGRAKAVLHGQARANLEEGLAVSFDQLIEDLSPRVVGECFEQVAHPPMIGK
jgi:hypothetical protein